MCDRGGEKGEGRSEEGEKGEKGRDSLTRVPVSELPDRLAPERPKGFGGDGATATFGTERE